VLLVVLGGLVTLFALVRWARVERAMRTREPLPAFSLGFVLTAAIVAGSVLLALAFV
jgi:inner membrane protein YidH